MSRSVACGLALVAALLAAGGAAAQPSPIVFDGTLGAPGDPPTLPFGSGTDYRILSTRGRIIGGSLFHSFERFGIPTGDAATFTGPAGLEAILARVTGGGRSDIDGLLRSEVPGADLFLMNPEGFLFGPNASILVPGSFTATSADALGFENGLDFFANPALDATATSVLDADPGDFGLLGQPVRFEFTAEPPGSITLDHAILQVADGATLRLIGGDILLLGDAGSFVALNAPVGRIDIVAVGSEGTVVLAPDDPGAGPDTSSFETLGKVRIRSGFLNVGLPGGDAGSIHVDAEDVTLARSSRLAADNGFVAYGAFAGGERGGVIQLRVRGALKITSGTGVVTSAATGGRIEIDAGSLLMNDGSIEAITLEDVLGGGVDGSEITIDADSVVLIGSVIDASGQGGGTLVLRGRELDMQDSAIGTLTLGNVDRGGVAVDVAMTESIDLDSSVILTNPSADGDAGGIRIVTGNLSTDALAQINSFAEAFAGGDSGDIEIVANDVDLEGAIQTSTENGFGVAGKVVIDVAGEFSSSGAVVASTGAYGPNADGTGTGSGGVEVTADIVELDDVSQVASQTYGPGDSGPITVNARVLDIRNSALGTATASTGDAGAVDVTAEEISLRGDDPTLPGDAGILSATYGFFFPGVATGDAGVVTVKAGTLDIQQGGVIRSGAFGGGGDAGDVNVEADSIFIARGDAVAPTGILSTAEYDDGDGGNVSVVANEITIRDGGEIRTGTFEQGDAGSISVLADRLFISGDGNAIPTGIKANATTGSSGMGGSVAVAVRELEIRDGGLIRSNAFGAGDAGDIDVSADTILITEGNESFTGITSGAEEGSGDGGEVHVSARSIELLKGGVIRSSTFTSGDAGKVEVAADHLVIDGSGTIRLTGINSDNSRTPEGPPVATGDAGTVVVEVKTLEMKNGGVIRSASFAYGAAGMVIIDADEISIDGQYNENGTGISSSTVGFAPAGGVAIEANELKMTKDARIQSLTAGSASGGTVLIDVDRIDMRKDSSILVASLATSEELGGAQPGDAGGIEIDTRKMTLDSSSITAEAADAFGGSIAVNGEGIETTPDGGLRPVIGSGQDPAYRVSLKDSQITSSVGAGEGDGGNVLINSRFVTSERSLIGASAVGGDGGNILVTSEGVFEPNADFDSQLDASSQEGVAGNVAVNSPETDVTSQVAPLRTTYLDAAARLPTSCAVRARADPGGSFTVVRRPVLPAAPDGVLLAFDEGAPAVRVTPGGSGEAPAPGAAAPPDFDVVQVARLRGRASVPGSGKAAVLKPFEEELARADASADPLRVATALGNLGNACLSLGEAARADEAFARLDALAADSGEPVRFGRLLNNIANQQALLGQTDRATATYERAANLPGDREARATALANAGRTALEAGRWERADELLHQAYTAAVGLPDTRRKTTLLLYVGESQVEVAERPDALRSPDVLRAHRTLATALEIATGLDDARGRSHANGLLGALYLDEHRRQEALVLTRRAIDQAEAALAGDLLARWHWQEGRILWAAGDANGALRSYRRSAAILAEVRPESTGSAPAAFRQAVVPVYVDYVDALLQSSGRVADPAAARALLVEARATMEQLKAAELRDYFRDECVAEIESKRVDIDQVSRRTRAAVVYPILLPDRTELLVSLPSGIERFVLDVPAETVGRAVEDYRRGLLRRIGSTYQRPARQLYDWMVRPYAEQLVSQAIQTLVFVPDGPLRTIPFSALDDGEGPLVRRWAVAVSPGLSLVDPQPLDMAQARLLLAGVGESVQGYAALPNAAREIEAIHALYGGHVLLDGAFDRDRFEAEVEAEAPSVVHVASHAVFTGDPATSFLLTHDSHITLEEIPGVVRPTQFQDRPLELLALSACDTAVGDERAALGLAGVAIQAGARSALGSLWRISDEATYPLIVAFYEALEDPNVSKAEALRRAQLEMIDSVAYSAPYYWSSFLLINNWL